jgi:hypothetical protein
LDIRPKLMSKLYIKLTWKLYRSSRCITFILVIFLFEKVIVTLFTNCTSHAFLYYKRELYILWTMLFPISQMKNDQNKCCKSWWVVQKSCLWLFHLESFGVLKCCLNFTLFEIQNLNGLNRVTWKFFKIKVIDLHKFYNFCVNNLPI